MVGTEQYTEDQKVYILYLRDIKGKSWAEIAQSCTTRFKNKQFTSNGVSYVHTKYKLDLSLVEKSRRYDEFAMAPPAHGQSSAGYDQPRGSHQYAGTPPFNNQNAHAQMDHTPRTAHAGFPSTVSNHGNHGIQGGIGHRYPAIHQFPFGQGHQRESPVGSGNPQQAAYGHITDVISMNMSQQQLYNQPQLHSTNQVMMAPSPYSGPQRQYQSGQKSMASAPLPTPKKEERVFSGHRDINKTIRGPSGNAAAKQRLRQNPVGPVLSQVPQGNGSSQQQLGAMVQPTPSHQPAINSPSAQRQREQQYHDANQPKLGSQTRYQQPNGPPQAWNIQRPNGHPQAWSFQQNQQPNGPHAMQPFQPIIEQQQVFQVMHLGPQRHNTGHVQSQMVVREPGHLAQPSPAPYPQNQQQVPHNNFPPPSATALPTQAQYGYNNAQNSGFPNNDFIDPHINEIQNMGHGNFGLVPGYGYNNAENSGFQNNEFQNMGHGNFGLIPGYGYNNAENSGFQNNEFQNMGHGNFGLIPGYGLDHNLGYQPPQTQNEGQLGNGSMRAIDVPAGGQRDFQGVPSNNLSLQSSHATPLQQLPDNENINSPMVGPPSPQYASSAHHNDIQAASPLPGSLPEPENNTEASSPETIQFDEDYFNTFTTLNEVEDQEPLSVGMPSGPAEEQGPLSPLFTPLPSPQSSTTANREVTVPPSAEQPLRQARSPLHTPMDALEIPIQALPIPEIPGPSTPSALPAQTQLQTPPLTNPNKRSLEPSSMAEENTDNKRPKQKREPESRPRVPNHGGEYRPEEEDEKVRKDAEFQAQVARMQAQQAQQARDQAAAQNPAPGVFPDWLTGDEMGPYMDTADTDLFRRT